MSACPCCTQSHLLLSIRRVTMLARLVCTAVVSVSSQSIVLCERGSSANRAPRHGDHNVGSHGLDQRNGAVDGFGPAERLLVV